MPVQLNKVIILAVEYMEKDYEHTRRCVVESGFPYYFVKRDPEGVGSLAEAINRGFKECDATDYEYCWIVTNIIFHRNTILKLIEVLDAIDGAAVHPSFESDHPHLQIRMHRPDFQVCHQVAPVPFIEFTAPLVRCSDFAEIQLDERMPYWGHDLDWSFQMYSFGRPLYVDYRTAVRHKYIRNAVNPESWTRDRLTARLATDAATKQALRQKYGKEWKSVVWPKTPADIGRFYSDVAKTIQL